MNERDNTDDESMTLSERIGVSIMCVSVAVFILTAVTMLVCATIVTVGDLGLDVPRDAWGLLMVSLGWSVGVMLMGLCGALTHECGTLWGSDRIALTVVMALMTVGQLACAGAAYRLVAANLPEAEPKVTWSIRLPESAEEREELPERLEPVRVDVPEQCPTGGSIVVAETDKGWDEWLQVGLSEQAEYAERCHIEYLDQQYDGKRLVLREIQPDGTEGDR